MSKTFVPKVGEYAVFDLQLDKKQENFWFVTINHNTEICHYSVKEKKDKKGIVYKGIIQERLQYQHTNPNIVKDSLGMCITWSDDVESGPGYKEVHSEKVVNADGFQKDDFEKLVPHFPGSKIIPLHQTDEPEAYVFYAPGGALKFDNHKEFFDEILNVPLSKVDSWVWMFQKWLNKKARLNTNIADKNQERDLDKKQCSVISFSDMPQARKMRESLNALGLDKVQNLNAEVNYYHVPKSGIGYHGDGERKKVFAFNFAKDNHVRHIEFQCFEGGKEVGKSVKIELKHADIYAMCVVASGNNWKDVMNKRGVRHWRHRAGFEEYLKDQDKAILAKRKRKSNMRKKNKK
jgi:hypothetical protein